MSENCFCHFNGYQVKDAYARRVLDGQFLSVSMFENNGYALRKAVGAAIEKGIKRIKIPHGRWNVAETVWIPSDFVLEGDGAESVLVADPSIGENPVINFEGVGGWDGDNLTTTTAKNIIMRDFAVDGNKKNRQDLVNAPNANTVSFPWIENVLVENVAVENSCGASFVFYNCKNVTVKNCHVAASGSNGILFLQKNVNCNVAGNYIDGTDNQNGIFFMYQAGRSSKNVRIENNTVINAADYGIEVGDHVLAQDAPHENVIVRGNTVIGAKNSAIAFRTVKNGRMQDNYVENCGSVGYGLTPIFVEGENQKSANIFVDGNTITNCSGEYIYVTGCEHVKICNNAVNGSGAKAIRIEASSCDANSNYPESRRTYNDIEIANNSVSGAFEISVECIGYNAERIKISGNKLVASSGNHVAISDIGASFKGVEIADNIISGSTNQGITLYKANDIKISENIINGSGRGKSNDDSMSGICIVACNGTSAKIAGNVFKDDSEDKTQKFVVTIHDASDTVIYFSDNEILHGSLRKYNADSVIFKNGAGGCFKNGEMRVNQQEGNNTVQEYTINYGTTFKAKPTVLISVTESHPDTMFLITAEVVSRNEYQFVVRVKNAHGWPASCNICWAAFGE